MCGTIGVIGVLVLVLAEVDKKTRDRRIKKSPKGGGKMCPEKNRTGNAACHTHKSVVLIVGMENGPTGRIGGSARIRVEEAPRCDPG